MPDAAQPPLHRLGEVRLRLQQGAPANLRHHARLGVARLVVLIGGDLLAFGAMRWLVRGVRDYDLLGVWVARRLQGAIPSGSLNVLGGSLYGWQFVAALFLGLLIFGNYGPGDRRRDPRRLFAASALATALPLWVTIWTRGFGPVVLQYSVIVVLVWLGLVTERVVSDRLVTWIRPPERDRLHTLFVGAAPDYRVALGRPAFANRGDYRPVGFVDVASPPAAEALGHVSELPALLAASRARVVALCGYLPDQQFQDVVDVALAGGCQVVSVPRSVEIAGVDPAMVWRRGQPLVELTAPSLQGWQLTIKRAVDVVGATLGLVVAAPVMGAIALAIRLDSRGSVLFRQERAGLGGRRFWMLKFRTMRVGADAQKPSVAHLNQTGDPRLFKIPNDPRVTGVGQWLRRWSLDELPQLWNVLVGDMSLVGPRPFFEADLVEYEDHHFGRLGARPGITGLWQVSGGSEIMDFEEVVRLDTRYIRDWSLLLDLEILLRTVPAIVRRRGTA